MALKYQKKLKSGERKIVIIENGIRVNNEIYVGIPAKVNQRESGSGARYDKTFQPTKQVKKITMQGTISFSSGTNVRGYVQIGGTQVLNKSHESCNIVKSDAYSNFDLHFYAYITGGSGRITITINNLIVWV